MNLTVKDDEPVVVASSHYGSELDVIGFNLTYIAKHDPNLLVDLLQLLKAARKAALKPLVEENDAQMAIALERLSRFMKTYFI